MEYQQKEYARYIKQQSLKYLIGRLGICGDYWVKKELTEELIEILEEDDG